MRRGRAWHVAPLITQAIQQTQLKHFCLPITKMKGPNETTNLGTQLGGLQSAQRITLTVSAHFSHFWSLLRIKTSLHLENSKKKNMEICATISGQTKSWGASGPLPVAIFLQTAAPEHRTRPQTRERCQCKCIIRIRVRHIECLWPPWPVRTARTCCMAMVPLCPWWSALATSRVFLHPSY